MYPVTATFREAVVASSQVALVKATVILDDSELGELPITSGSVDCDGTRDGALRSLSLTVAPDPSAFDWLAAAGAEIAVSRGLRHAGGDELVPLGVFILDADLEEAADGTITVSAADRSQRISRSRWTDPYAVAAGANVGEALADLLATAWPDCPIGTTLAAVDKTTGAKLSYLDGADSDPGRMPALGGVGRPRPVLRRLRRRPGARDPDPESHPVCASYSAGESAIVLGLVRTAKLTQLYNGVIVTAEGSGVGTPKRGEAWDEDPNSPTYCYGPMGLVPSSTARPSSPPKRRSTRPQRRCWRASSGHRAGLIHARPQPRARGLRCGRVRRRGRLGPPLHVRRRVDPAGLRRAYDRHRTRDGGRLMRELAETLKRRQSLRMRQGVVTAVDGSTCSVLIGGSEVPVDGVQHLNSCAPAAGEVVWIASDGADLWIVGTHGDPPPIDPSRLPAFETYFSDADPAGDPAAVTGLSGSAGLTGTHLVWDLPPEALWRTWKVFQGMTSGFTPGDPVLVTDAPVVTVPNEPGSGPWYYKVRAVNSRGEESADVQVGPFTLPTVLAEIPNGSIAGVKISTSRSRRRSWRRTR